MPVDLDELLDALGRQADATPLGTADQARARGRRRTRRQATISAAVAVCLVAVGMGAVLSRPRHDPDQTVGPTPNHSLSEVGSPFEFGGTTDVAVPSISGGRVFTTWRTADGTVRLNAVDLHTGKPVWAPRTVGKFDELGGGFAMPQALVVTVVPDRDAVPPTGSNPDRTEYVYDPADGRLRWKFTMHFTDEIEYYDQALVQTSAETGVTRAYDWVTGAVRWNLPGGADRTVRTLGMEPAGNGHIYADNRLVRVMRSGQVQVRDVTTGTLVRTTSVRPPSAEANTYLAFDGQLFDVSRVAGVFRVSATDLTGKDTSGVLLDLAAGHEVDGMWQCGTGRLCLLDKAPDNTSTAVAVDVAQRRVLWRAQGPLEGTPGDSLRGYTRLGGMEAMVLDPNGKKLFGSLEDEVLWLGDDALLVMPATGAGNAVRVRLADGERTPLGTLPGGRTLCQNTADRLVCTTETGVRIWNLSG